MSSLKALLVRDLGLKEYTTVWELQKRLVYERAEGTCPDTVLLCQHPGVYTIGRSSKQAVPSGLPDPIHVVERGGDITWHGPGQLVGYPILDLATLDLTATPYLRALEAVLAETLLPFGIEAAPVKGFTGLWAGRKKLVSIGIAVSGGISYHGFALNMNNGFAAFGRVNPCKLESDVMTSMARLLGRPVDERAVTESVGKALIQYFDYGAATAPLTDDVGA